MDSAGAASIDSSRVMVAGRTFSSSLAWRSPCARTSAYTCAIQKTTRVAAVAAKMSPGRSSWALAATTAVATIVP